MNIVFAVIWFLVLGGAFGLMLAFAAKIFEVKTDERIERIADALPGANCGGCGYTGCAALAEAIAGGSAPVNSCPAGGRDMIEKIAVVMGTDAIDNVRYRACVMCSGTNDLAKQKYKYVGIDDCIPASRLAGGSKTCPNGCLGLGSCAKHCKFGAIKIINGVAAVDYEKCTACSACIAACPKKLIRMIPFDSTHWVGCMSTDKGAVTRKYCDVGCIACKMCEKKCPHDAIKINEMVASIDQTKCERCGVCEAKAVCPRKIIWSGKSQKAEGIVREKEQIDSGRL